MSAQVTDDTAASSWQRVDLGAAMNGQLRRPEPTVLDRGDGRCLFYRGRLNGLHGADGEGKSWVGMVAVAQELKKGHHVVWIDLEDDENVVIERLALLGVKDSAIARGVHYYRPDEPFTTGALQIVRSDIKKHKASLIVADSLGEAFSLESLDEDRDVQVGPWLRQWMRPLADAGPAVVLIDHKAHSGDPLRAAGSKRKRAAISGASFLVQGKPAPTRDRSGKLILRCAKDRHGHYKRGATIAEVVFDVDTENGTNIRMSPPPETSTGPDHEQITELARAAVRACREADEPLNTTALEKAMGPGRSEAKRAGIRAAIDAGWITRQEGSGRALLHTFVNNPDDE